MADPSPFDDYDLPNEADAQPQAKPEPVPDEDPFGAPVPEAQDPVPAGVAARARCLPQRPAERGRSWVA